MFSESAFLNDAEWYGSLNASGDLEYFGKSAEEFIAHYEVQDYLVVSYILVGQGGKGDFQQDFIHFDGGMEKLVYLISHASSSG